MYIKLQIKHKATYMCTTIYMLHDYVATGIANSISLKIYGFL